MRFPKTFLLFIVVLPCLLSAEVAYSQSPQASLAQLMSKKYFNREKIKFDSKHLENFSIPIYKGRIVQLKENRHRLKKDHPFVIAVRWGNEKSQSLLQLSSFEGDRLYSIEFMKLLKEFMSETGRNKYLSKIAFENSQRGAFQRRSVVAELNKKNVINELLFVAKNYASRGTAEFEAKNIPPYDFDLEKFTFKLGFASPCTYAFNIPTAKAAELANSWQIYWEARVLSDDGSGIIDVYLEGFPPKPPLFSVNTDECK